MVNNIYVSVITGVICAITFAMIIGIFWANGIDNNNIKNKKDDNQIPIN